MQWACKRWVHAGDAGDDLIVPELAQYLATPGLHSATEQALWAVFHRSPNPSVQELMNQARPSACTADCSSSNGIQAPLGVMLLPISIHAKA